MKKVLLLSLCLLPGLVQAADGLPQGPPRLDPPSRWALVIGVNSHEDTAIPKNERAVSDAQAVARLLTATAGWPADHVMILADGGSLKHGDKSDPGRRFAPSKENLDWAVREWLSSRVKPGDFLLVYFAGHAISLPPLKDALPGSRPRDYLLPADARSADYDLTGWSLDAALDGLPARGVNPLVVWLDTSAVGRGAGVPGRPENLARPTRMIETLAAWPRVSAWMAGGAQPIPESTRADLPGALVSTLVGALGTAERPSTLLSVLNQARKSPTLIGQGFAAVGGVDPDWTIWAGAAEKRIRPNGDLIVQAGHADRITSIVMAADAGWMATASMDSTVKIWSKRDQAVLNTIAGFSQGVRSLALSPDGRRLIAGDGVGNVRFWERASAGPAARSGATPHAGPVDHVAYLPDGVTAISLDLIEGKALIWNTAAPDATPRRLSDEQVAGFAVGSRRASIVAAIADMKGRVSLLSIDGRVVRVLERPAAPVSALAFSDDQKEIAVAEESGKIQRFDVAGGKALGEPIKLAAKPDFMAYTPSGTLIYRVGRLVGSSNGNTADLLPNEAGRLTLSVDGRTLAHADDAVDGSLHLYGADESGAFKPASLATPKTETGGLTAAAITPDGRSVVEGHASGLLRLVSLTDGSVEFQARPNRSRVAQIAASPDGKTLLHINAPDGRAALIDLADGSIRSLSGYWSAGAFVDASTIILTEAGDSLGDPKLLDTRSGAIQTRRFTRPQAATNTIFDKVLVSPDGTWVAAGSKAGQAPTLVVWETKTGKPLGLIREEGLDLNTIALDRTGTRIALGIDARTLIHEIKSAPWSTKQIAVNDLAAAEPENTQASVTAAEWMGDGRLVLGTLGGRIQVWDPAGGKVTRLPGGSLAGAVRSLFATKDGRWLAGAGEDLTIRLWSVAGGAIAPVMLAGGFSHSERINTLTAFKDGPVLISGSDDTRVRFWSLKGRQLLGSLNLVVTKPGAKVVTPLDSPEWLCVTPAGLFDASHNGTDLARWTIGEEVRSIEQLADKGYYVHQMTSYLLKGEAPPKAVPPAVEPPAITLQVSKNRTANDREAELTVNLGEGGLPDLRLYHDGVPIQSSLDFQPTADHKRFTTTVRLHSGENRFWVMAGRPDRIDGRSTTLAAQFTGPDFPPRLHVIALGISEYQRRALQYADDDAKAMSDFLHQRGLTLGGEPGKKILLTDRQVVADKIEQGFREIRAEVKKNPQDTVVVFIAGHTDVLEKKFCLLLPDYPFEENEPLIVASRGGDGRAAKNPNAILPYGTIYTQIARLNSLQRLVVVDACQAEAIKSDPQVELIRRYMATDSRKAKTSYLFAAREGEAATEVSDLKHGLLTYSVLRGFRAEGLSVASDPFAGASVPDDADLNNDGIIETRELEYYVKSTMPVLASKYNSLVKRGEPSPVPSTAAAPFKLQADDASFPILPLSKGK